MTEDKVQEKYALFTIVNDSYVAGFFAMVTSFLENNSWFKGEILVGYSNPRCKLSQANKQKIQSQFKNIKFTEVSEQPYAKIIKSKFTSHNERLIPALFKLNSFELQHYDRVVFIDSDILILKNLKFLFETKEGFIAYKDQATKQAAKDIDAYVNYQSIPFGTVLFNTYHRSYAAIRQVLTRNTSFLKLPFLAIFYPLDALFYHYRSEYHPSHYLNTGVLSISKEFAKQHPLSKILEVAQGCFSLPLADQSVLNYYAYKKFGSIKLFANKRNGIKTKYTDENFSNMKIDNPDFIHYVGKKPWDQGAEEYTYLKLSLSGRNANVILRMDEQYSKINLLWQAQYKRTAHSKFQNKEIKNGNKKN